MPVLESSACETPDCRGADGTDGADGVDGVHCWDVSGDRQCDETTEDINGDGTCDVLDCRASAEAGALEIVEVDDPKLTYTPAIGCGDGEWCDEPEGWGTNRFAASGRYTMCEGEADCSENTIVLSLDNNTHRSVQLAHLDADNSGVITVHLSFDGGATYAFHKAINTRRATVQTPYTSTIWTIASNLPLGANIRIRLTAAKGRMNFEGFALSPRVLSDNNPRFQSRSWVSANGPEDGTCEVNDTCGPSPLATRMLTFVKTKDDTTVRIQYVDSMRSYSGDGVTRGCRWQVLFDGIPCPSGDIFGAIYSLGGPAGNLHRMTPVSGYCSGLAAGTYTVQVYVSNVPNLRARCYTGWLSQRWLLEAEEIQ